MKGSWKLRSRVRSAVGDQIQKVAEDDPFSNE